MKYRKRADEVEATQWNEHGDHPEVSPVGAGRDSCVLVSCPLPWNKHGRLGRYIVCPGDWIVESGGSRTLVSAEDFAGCFEPVEAITVTNRCAGCGFE